MTEPEQLAAAAADLAERWDRLDGLLHAIGFAPAELPGRRTCSRAEWDDVAVALNISAYSLKALVEAFRPLLGGRADGGASVVGLDFDATVAWPAYDWMGVAKAALESLDPLPGPRPRARADPGQPGGGRPDPDDGGQVDPGLLRRSRTPGPSGRRSAGTSTTPSRWRGPAWRCSRTGSR